MSLKIIQQDKRRDKQRRDCTDETRWAETEGAEEAELTTMDRPLRHASRAATLGTAVVITLIFHTQSLEAAATGRLGQALSVNHLKIEVEKEKDEVNALLLSNHT